MIILQSLYFFLPAYFSNMAPVIFGKFNFLRVPVDFGRTLCGKPIFGQNKTWGGIIYAIVFGTLIFFIQKQLYANGMLKSLALFDYNSQPLILGALLASGAILGDLGKSFIKRRLGKEPGEKWLVADQMDLVIGAFLFSFWIYIPPIEALIVLFISTPVLHYLSNILGFYLGLKNVKW